MHIHHIGYLVKKLDKAKDAFSKLGFCEQGAAVYDQIRDVHILFMKKDAYVVELVSPASGHSVVSNLIKTYKNAPYHICYIAENFEADIKRLECSGFTRIDAPSPAPAIGNRKVCFLLSPAIGLIEILEPKKESEV